MGMSKKTKAELEAENIAYRDRLNAIAVTLEMLESAYNNYVEENNNLFKELKEENKLLGFKLSHAESDAEKWEMMYEYEKNKPWWKKLWVR